MHSCRRKVDGCADILILAEFLLLCNAAVVTGGCRGMLLLIVQVSPWCRTLFSLMDLIKNGRFNDASLFTRSYRVLPTDADADKITAEYKHGGAQSS